jgi:hypothetical protein
MLRRRAPKQPMQLLLWSRTDLLVRNLLRTCFTTYMLRRRAPKQPTQLLLWSRTAPADALWAWRFGSSYTPYPARQPACVSIRQRMLGGHGALAVHIRRIQRAIRE